MTLRYKSVAAAAVGLWMAFPHAGQPATPEPTEPARLGVANSPDLPTATPSANQRTADSIAEALRQSIILRRYDLSISFQNGTAELHGQVSSLSQREDLRRLVQGVVGVERVQDLTTIADVPTIAQAQAVVPGPLVEPPPLAPKVPAVAAVPGAAVPAIPGAALPTMPGAAVPAEPTPIYQVPPVPNTETNPPPMPPYAWPTYAPYNNFSRVAYPTLYPYQAWPFIGPIYPFPKVPPGWRSIKLDWYDGYWWYGKVPNPHDWWRIRYW